MSDIEENDTSSLQEWNATINRLQSPSGEQFPVGELTITLKNSKYVTKPNIFIGILDQSGSMHGSPWNQVKAAMLYMYGLSLVHESLQLFLIPIRH